MWSALPTPTFLTSYPISLPLDYSAPATLLFMLFFCHNKYKLSLALFLLAYFTPDIFMTKYLFIQMLYFSMKSTLTAMFKSPATYSTPLYFAVFSQLLLPSNILYNFIFIIFIFNYLLLSH